MLRERFDGNDRDVWVTAVHTLERLEAAVLAKHAAAVVKHFDYSKCHNLAAQQGTLLGSWTLHVLQRKQQPFLRRFGVPGSGVREQAADALGMRHAAETS